MKNFIKKFEIGSSGKSQGNCCDVGMKETVNSQEKEHGSCCGSETNESSSSCCTTETKVNNSSCCG